VNHPHLLPGFWSKKGPSLRSASDGKEFIWHSNIEKIAGRAVFSGERTANKSTVATKNQTSAMKRAFKNIGYGGHRKPKGPTRD
jgi:hypothetical protein